MLHKIVAVFTVAIALALVRLSRFVVGGGRRERLLLRANLRDHRVEGGVPIRGPREHVVEQTLREPMKIERCIRTAHIPPTR